MANKLSISRNDDSRPKCDYCQGRKSLNQQVVHILSHDSREVLSDHLSGSCSPAVKVFFLDMWDMAHLVYGHLSRDKFQPLALVYLEEHGVNVPNRFEWITRYRDRKAG